MFSVSAIPKAFAPKGSLRLFGLLSFALIAAFLLGVPAPALAEQADLEVTGEVISASGAERSVRVTLTNNGPDHVDVTNNIGIDLVPLGAKILSVEPCGPTNNFVSGNGRRNCGFGKKLAAGASVSLVARVRVTDSPAQINAYVYSSDGCVCEPDDPRLLRDPYPDNNGAYIRLDAPAACKIVAKSPQYLKRETLVVKVVAPASAGCSATLRAVDLRVGGRTKFRLRDPRSKVLEAGETWTLRLKYGPAVEALRKARRRGKHVSARCVFELDQRTVSKVITLK